MHRLGRSMNPRRMASQRRKGFRGGVITDIRAAKDSRFLDRSRRPLWHKYQEGRDHDQVAQHRLGKPSPRQAGRDENVGPDRSRRGGGRGLGNDRSRYRSTRFRMKTRCRCSVSNSSRGGGGSKAILTHNLGAVTMNDCLED